MARNYFLPPLHSLSRSRSFRVLSTNYLFFFPNVLVLAACNTLKVGGRCCSSVGQRSARRLLTTLLFPTLGIGRIEACTFTAILQGAALLTAVLPAALLRPLQ